jgi:ribonuclease HI
MMGARHAAVLRHLAAAAREGATRWPPEGIAPAEAAAALEAGAEALESSRRLKGAVPGRRRADRLGAPEGPARPGGGASARIHVDGASRGNPGPAGVGAVLEGLPDGTRLTHSGYVGVTTNNVAEYQALLWALGEARRRGCSAVEIFSDSELLVRQMRGQYRVKQPHLQALHAQVTALAREFRAFRIQYVPRELNAEADALANRGIEERTRPVASRRAAGGAD